MHAGGNVKYKLLAIDVDGTLLDEKHRLSKENIQAVRGLLDQHVRVVLFSGRGYKALRGIVKTLGLKDAVVTQNGSVILDGAGDIVLLEEMISPKDCSKILVYSKSNGYCPLIYQGNEVYSELKGKYLDIFEECMAQKVIYTEDILETYQNQPLGKILVLDEPPRVRQFKEWISKTMNSAVSAELAFDFSLEIGGSDKGKALKWLSLYYNISYEYIAAVGDGENDISMLEFAGLGIAMGNAMDNIKKIADQVTLSNNDNGVAYVIEKYMN